MRKATILGFLPLIGLLITAYIPAQDDRPAAATMTRQLGTQVLTNELLKKDVRNRAGNDLGDVEDLIINRTDGRISYVIVSSGGVLGIGDRLTAVPWTAVRYEKGDDVRLILDMTSDRLREAPKFEWRTIPDTGRPDWSAEVDRFFNVSTPAGDQAFGGRVSELHDANIRNAENKTIGEVETLVADVDRGRITYVVIEGNRDSNFNNRFTAVPWRALDVNLKEKRLKLKASDSALANAHTFTKDEWPNLSDQSYAARVYANYGIPMDLGPGLTDAERTGRPVGTGDREIGGERAEPERGLPVPGERRDVEGERTRTGRELTEAERRAERERERLRDPKTHREPATGERTEPREPIDRDIPRDESGRVVAPAEARPVFQASRIIGIPARNARGEELGRVEDIVLDPATGQALYIVVNLGQPAGQLRAIPWTLWRHSGNTFSVDVDRNRLTNAPGFTSDEVHNLSRPEWRTRLEQHYGITPRTTEPDRQTEAERMREKERMDEKMREVERKREQNRDVNR